VTEEEDRELGPEPLSELLKRHAPRKPPMFDELKKKNEPEPGTQKPVKKMTYDDLRRPEPECQLPEPVRTEENPYPYPTCPHCNLVFMLVDRDKGTCEWVVKADHELLIAQMPRVREEYNEEREWPTGERYPYA